LRMREAGIGDHRQMNRLIFFQQSLDQRRNRRHFTDRTGMQPERVFTRLRQIEGEMLSPAGVCFCFFLMHIRIAAGNAPSIQQRIVGAWLVSDAGKDYIQVSL